MSQPHRSLGPVIAYLITLLGLTLGGIWLWNVLRSAPGPQDGVEMPVAPATQTAPPGEEFSRTERQQLEEILRRKPAGAPH